MSWIIFLSVIGIILICFEMFLPGMVVGAVGALCLVAAVILTYTMHGVASGNFALITLLVASVVGLLLWTFLFPKTKMGKILITHRDLAGSKTADSLAMFLGKSGKALTPLRPAGTASIDNQRVDVVAESGMIDQESIIRVILVEGNHVVVRKI